jgi:hypothetical protein
MVGNAHQPRMAASANKADMIWMKVTLDRDSAEGPSGLLCDVSIIG